MKTIERTRAHRATLFVLRTAAAALFLSFIYTGSADAVTRSELLVSLWGAMGYDAAPEMKLPPDVPLTHRHAKQIGHAARWGLINAAEPFGPEDNLNRHEAVRLALRMIGWGFEVSLCDALASLPDFGGSGDSVFFLASEMKPSPPSGLLIDGATALSEGGARSLTEWAKACKAGVRWNRVYSYGGTELSLFRQGVARPGEPNKPTDGGIVGAPECEPLFVASLAVKLTDVDQRIAFSLPFGRPRVAPTDFADSYDAIAAVNGGYFADAHPIGTMLLNGEHVGKPIIGRSAFGWHNETGALAFGRGGARVAARIGGALADIAAYNAAPGPNEAALYSSEIMRATIGAALNTTRVITQGGVVTEVRDRSNSDFWLPDNSLTLVLHGNSAAPFESVKPGDRLELITAWESDAFESCRDMIQAGPMLMLDGRFTSDPETFKPDITDKRHPRTIVGTDGLRVIWAVVDGRSSLHSRGATIAEARYIARSLGMTSALNLDGGGSSQLVWRGVLVNSPSDGHQRPIPYSVVFLPKGSEMKWHAPAGESEWGEWGSPVPLEEGPVYMDTWNPNGGN